MHKNIFVAIKIVIFVSVLYADGINRIGFVLQDDVVFPHLTVKETLTYAALLRLPNTLTKQQKKERAISVICELGLERCFLSFNSICNFITSSCSHIIASCHVMEQLHGLHV